MNDDLFLNILRWTTGYCVMWNQMTKQFSDTDTQNFQDFIYRTNTVVYRFLQGQQTLDGSCSDMECDAALQAQHIFRDLIKTSN